MYRILPDCGVCAAFFQIAEYVPHSSRLQSMCRMLPDCGICTAFFQIAEYVPHSSRLRICTAFFQIADMCRILPDCGYVPHSSRLRLCTVKDYYAHFSIQMVIGVIPSLYQLNVIRLGRCGFLTALGPAKYP